MNSKPHLAREAELIKADQALKSFRDGGYNLSDAVGELVDNPLDSGATKIWVDWKTSTVPIGNSKKVRTHIDTFAVCDNGQGIAENVLANILTVGFSTRYGMRSTIGRFGVGFKLASISQCKRIEVYSKPAYLRAVEPSGNGEKWSLQEANSEGRIFKTYLDLDEIEKGEQKGYRCEADPELPKDYAHLLRTLSSGVLVVWSKCDRLNENHPYSETLEEMLADLQYFLSRTYRHYIDGGLSIYLNGNSEPLPPYDPSFKIDNPLASRLANGRPMIGEEVESGHFLIDDQRVDWSVALTPPITRMNSGGGGEEGPDDKKQFRKLHILDNQGKISFLRRRREISYTIVPKMLPGGVEPIDRYIGITVAFSPELDEYFQVRHIKRGAEPVAKLREELRRKLEKPIRAARRRIRAVWAESARKAADAPSENPAGGGRTNAENVASEAQAGLPSGNAGTTVSEEQTRERLKEAALEVGITDPIKQQEFIDKVKQKPLVALDRNWPGKGLIDIEHLNQLVLVKINRSHPFIRDVYLPLKQASVSQISEMDAASLQPLLAKATDAIDLLFFAYAKAENMSRDPEERYSDLREYWGQFAATYLRKRDDVTVE